MEHEVVAIAAIGKTTRALGKDNDLLWNIPSDLARFRDLTKGHPVIMGYKTWESLPRKPLPNRTNIVMSLDPDVKLPEGVHLANSPEEALNIAKESKGSNRIIIMGGGIIYKVMLPYTDTLMLTLVDDSDGIDADVFFPEYAAEFNEKVSEGTHEENGVRFEYVTFARAT